MELVFPFLGTYCTGVDRMSDLICKRTRQEFREYFMGTSLRIIGDAFDAESVPCDRNYSPPEGGQRRSFVEQYYHLVDWRNPSDAARILRVFGSVLLDLEQAKTPLLCHDLPS